jgi:hypothetical protein
LDSIARKLAKFALPACCGSASASSLCGSQRTSIITIGRQTFADKFQLPKPPETCASPSPFVRAENPKISPHCPLRRRVLEFKRTGGHGAGMYPRTDSVLEFVSECKGWVDSDIPIPNDQLVRREINSVVFCRGYGLGIIKALQVTDFAVLAEAHHAKLLDERADSDIPSPNG